MGNIYHVSVQVRSLVFDDTHSYKSLLYHAMMLILSECSFERDFSVNLHMFIKK